jgi:hypothetical protein
MPSFRDIDDLIHTWAQNNDGRGSCGNVRYDGRALYSYRDVIGIFVPGPNGAGCLVGTGGSQTTTTHTNKAWSALDGWMSRRRFVVYCDIDTRTTPADARAAWEPRILRACVDYTEATRKPSKAKHLRILREYIAAANELCAFFDLPLFDAAPADASVDAWIGTRSAAEVARRAAEKAKRDARDAADRLDARERLALWLTGADVTRRGFDALRPEVGDCLRVSSDGDVETTQGARVPLAHVAERAPLLLRMVRGGRAWARNGHTIHLGHYSVDRIEEDGTLHAGCHTFHRAELERFAGAIGAVAASE